MYQADAGYFACTCSMPPAGSSSICIPTRVTSPGYGSTSFNSGAAYSSQTVASGSYLGVAVVRQCRVFPLRRRRLVLLHRANREHHLRAVLVRGDDQDLHVHRRRLPVGHLQHLCAGRHRRQHQQVESWLHSGVDIVRAFYSGITRQLDSYSPIAFNGVTPLYPATIEVGRPMPFLFLLDDGVMPRGCACCA